MTQTQIAGERIRLTVNGEGRDAAAGCTLSELLSDLGLDPRMIVVEHNGNILRERATFDHLQLQPDDVLELVHFVGGG